MWNTHMESYMDMRKLDKIVLGENVFNLLLKVLIPWLMK